MPHFSMSYGFASKNKLLLMSDGSHVNIMISKATPASAIGEVIRNINVCSVILNDETDLLQRIHEFYTDKGNAARIVDSVQDEVDLSLLIQEVDVTQDLLAAEDGAPVIRILNALLLEAVKKGASDIHIEAYEIYSIVRMRVDGLLSEIARPKRELHKALMSRLKIMAGLDIAESRLPQDGRISTRLGNRLIDIRVSTLPNSYGERAVLRLLEKSGNKLSLETTGMSLELIKEFDSLLKKPHGIILVTGPTGSGKTTTLYSSLKRLDAKSMNILTVEDPIEYELIGIGQSQINSKIGFNFADALRSILRQDPDIVMVGEIRDSETAKIAIQASLTGHLVLATLHTNDASSAITRLIDMGVESYLLASSLLGVLAQRLVRKIDKANIENFQGRTGIYELLIVNDEIRNFITLKASDKKIREAAVLNGMKTMQEYGEELVRRNVTTKEEIILATSS